jgi:hypothetical protein
MDCKTAQKNLFDDSRDVAAHLKGCGDCSTRAVEHQQMRSALRQLPKRMAPPQLSASLRVLASQERLRNVGKDFNWRERVHMFARDLMKPFAVPAFGGLASAIVIFSALMPSLAMPIPVHDDVPLALVTEPSVKYFAPIGISESELVVDLVIDGSGRMVDYTVIRGQNLLKDMHMRRQLENNLLFTEFIPATKFGGPSSGKVRLWIKSSQINIRG